MTSHAKPPSPDIDLPGFENPAGLRPLPKGWRWARLGEVCEFVRGVSFDPSEISPRPTNGYLPILRAGNIANSLNTTHDLIWVVADRVSPEQRLLAGDIAICMSSGSPKVVGKTAQLKVPFDGSVGAFCGIIRPRAREHSDYLAYWLLSPDFIEWRDGQARGANIQNLRFSQFEILLLPMPPLPEQQRIAAVLNEQMAAVEQARTAAEAQLEAARALPVAYLREVFESEEARGWPYKKLGELCEIQLGKMLSPASKTGTRPRPYLRNANVQWGRFDLSDVAEMDFVEEQEQKLALKPGDLIVCEGGEPGRAAVWEGQIEPCYYQKALHRLRPISQSIDPHFIMYRLWYNSLKGEFTESQAKTTIAHLPVVRLQELPIYLPTLAVQRTIATTLNAQFANTERTRGLLEAQLAAIEQLPGALLRRAFAGEI